MSSVGHFRVETPDGWWSVGAVDYWCVVRAGASLTLVRDPRVGSGVGDMMFDGVIPLGEALRPLGLSGPSTKRWRQEI
jgi:hypothetical protein